MPAALGCDASDTAVNEDIDVLNPNLSTHYASEATGATAHLRAMLSRAARLMHTRLNVRQSVSEQLRKIRFRHIVSNRTIRKP